MMRLGVWKIAIGRTSKDEIMGITKLYNSVNAMKKTANLQKRSPLSPIALCSTVSKEDHFLDGRSCVPGPLWHLALADFSLSPQLPNYENRSLFESVVQSLGRQSPLVSTAEMDLFFEDWACVEAGSALVLCIGECAEKLTDDHDASIDSIIAWLDLAKGLVQKTGKKIILLGRYAGQMAKPRSQLWETINGQEIPAYRGDLINSNKASMDARAPDPTLMIQCYDQSRALRLHLQNHLGMDSLGDLSTVGYDHISCYFAHEALLLPYEVALTRSMEPMEKPLSRHHIDDMHDTLARPLAIKAMEKEQYYGGSAHFLWIGERTKQKKGPHIDFIRTVQNPTGLKCSADTCPKEIMDNVSIILEKRCYQHQIPLITRFGSSDQSLKKLDEFLCQISGANAPVMIMCDPMHGNTHKAVDKSKYRIVDEMCHELEITISLCKKYGLCFAGLFLEASTDTIEECVSFKDIDGGILSRDRLYTSACDPRLDLQQTKDMMDVLVTAFCQ